MKLLFFRIFAVLGFLGVALGAFGAHGLKPILIKNETLEVWDKAVRYHFIHALAIMLLCTLPTFPRGSAFSFLVGIVLFSGSLYIYSITKIRPLAMITPIGGLAFLVGWVWLFFYSFRNAPFTNV